MVISFDTEDLRRICCEFTAAIEAYGFAIAEALQARLADLDSATRLSELIVGDLQCFGEGIEQSFALTLTAGVNIVFVAITPRRGRSPMMGSVSRDAVTRIKIIKIERSE